MSHRLTLIGMTRWHLSSYGKEAVATSFYQQEAMSPEIKRNNPRKSWIITAGKKSYGKTKTIESLATHAALKVSNNKTNNCRRSGSSIGRRCPDRGTSEKWIVAPMILSCLLASELPNQSVAFSPVLCDCKQQKVKGSWVWNATQYVENIKYTQIRHQRRIVFVQ